jgi:hypothetical protein
MNKECENQQELTTCKWIWLERTTTIILCAALLFNLGYVLSHTRLDNPNILNGMANPEWYRNGAIILFALGVLLLLGTLILRKQKTSLSCFWLTGFNLLMLCMRK